MRQRLTGIRGQLVLWYLGILAALLLGLGAFQSVTLAGYLRSSTIDSLQQAAHAELAVLGPCFIRSTKGLNRNAQSLAQLLGSHDTAVKIVTTTGVTLADHGRGPPGAARPLRLSAGTIRTLIRAAHHATVVPGAGVLPRCRASLPPPHPRPLRRVRTPIGSVESGDMLLVAVPLGPRGHTVGYAILGRSLAAADATVSQARIVFAVGGAIALIIAALVALPIIDRALRPLRRIAATAESIAAGELEKRANLAHSRDEIGRLGNAFDRMVDWLQIALAGATDSEERMRRFLADASHELRTPLTVLRGASQVLLRQSAGEGSDVAAAVRDMHEEAVRLSRLVDDLLTLSRLDAGQALDPKPLVLRPFLDSFIERYARVWPARAIIVDHRGIDRATVSADPDALTQILTNLVDNAARYAAPGGAITIGGAVDGETVTVSVIDEGPGLSAEDAERAFERFYRGNKSRSRQSGGTGLGLAIVHGLAGASGGEVHIETGPQRGTTISITLPRSDGTTVE